MKANSKGQIRIIGGEWRSRKLHFPATAMLRPTPDSVRETLFNWLQADIAGSRCLDLFSGSGALGFEAASRGAKQVTLVESDAKVARQLKENIFILDAKDVVHVEQRLCQSFLEAQQKPYDIVFADPPFDLALLKPTCEMIASSKAVSSKTLLYLESPRSREPLPIPPNWHIIQQKAQGRVQSTLIQTAAQ